MLRNEIQNKKISPDWTNQFLNILKLRIHHGDLDKYTIIQGETFLHDVSKIADMIKDVETYNHILLVKDHIHEEFRYTRNEEREVIRCVLFMLDEMVNALVYFKTERFKSIKEDIIKMLGFAENNSQGNT